MTIDSKHDEAAAILSDPKRYTRQKAYNAVLDLRRNSPVPSDKALLEPLMAYDDDMIVAAVLYSLINVYGSPSEYRSQIMAQKGGDRRDTGEMPIQTQAIEGLSELAKTDSVALSELWKIAESTEVAECPRARAWHCLARHAKVEWDREDTETMVWDPNSEQSEQIRNRIRTAFQNTA